MRGATDWGRKRSLGTIVRPPLTYGVSEKFGVACRNTALYATANWTMVPWDFFTTYSYHTGTDCEDTRILYPIRLTHCSDVGA